MDTHNHTMMTVNGSIYYERPDETIHDTEEIIANPRKRSAADVVNHDKSNEAVDNNTLNSNACTTSVGQQESASMSVSTSENISRRETSKFDHDREIVDDSIPALDDMTVSIDVTCIADNGTTVNVGVEDSINLEENNCDDEDDDGIIESHQADSSRTGLSLKYNEKWMQRLNELRQYKEQFGDCLVPRNYEAAPGLGSWIHNQRTQYKLFKAGIHSRITPERVELLESVGFVWDAREHSLNTKSGTDDGSSQQKLSKRRRKPQDTKWLKKFEELCKYKVSFAFILGIDRYALLTLSHRFWSGKIWKHSSTSKFCN